MSSSTICIVWTLDFLCGSLGCSEPYKKKPWQCSKKLVVEQKVICDLNWQPLYLWIQRVAKKQHLSLQKSYCLTQHLVSLSGSHRTLRSSLGISSAPHFRRRQNREWTGSWVWMGHTQGWGPCSGWTYEPVSGLWHG